MKPATLSEEPARADEGGYRSHCGHASPILSFKACAVDNDGFPVEQESEAVKDTYKCWFRKVVSKCEASQVERYSQPGRTAAAASVFRVMISLAASSNLVPFIFSI